MDGWILLRRLVLLEHLAVLIKFMNMVIKKELCALKYCGPVKVKIVIDRGHNHDVTG